MKILKSSWQKKKLLEVCENITDGTHQTPKYFDEGYIFLSSRNVTSGKIDWSDIKYIDEKQHIDLHKRVAPKVGDILLAKNGTTGVAAMVDKDVVFDIYVSLALLRSKGDVSPYYLLHFINSPVAKKQFNARLKGIGVPNLHLKEIREVEIPYPKISEQQAIVEKLDIAFDAIEKAKANIEKNIENAKELFQSKLNAIFSQKGEGWEEKTLGDISKINYGFTEKASFINIGPKFLRITDIKVTGVDWADVPHCKISDLDIPKYKLEIGDIVFARTGATTGKSYLIKDNVNSVFASYLIRLKVKNKNVILPQFIYLFFQSGDYWQSINAGITGSAQGGFNATKLADLRISFPTSLNNQTKLIDELEYLSQQIDFLQEKYKYKLANLEELKKSILEKAFKGELV